MGLNAAVQALKKADALKEKVLSRDLVKDNEAWACQKELQRIYQQVLILDLEYALDKKVEQELWNHGFKNYIATLQVLAKDKKNPKRSEFQGLLSCSLDAASGFYLTLLQEICTAFNLDLPFRRKSIVYGCTNKLRSVEQLSRPQKSSCYYICQHCLVHLGDIARYRAQCKQAEAFYRHAVELSPSSGQPYNQLALLEASRGDRLSTVYHYVRSVAVRHKFPAGATNLSLTLDKCADANLSVDGSGGQSKLSGSECISLFLKVHALLYHATQLQDCSLLLPVLNQSLTAHIATHSFSSDKLVQMVAINIFAFIHCRDGSAGNMDETVPTQLTSEEVVVLGMISQLIAGLLTASLLPIYTLKHDATLLDYFALPAVKLTLEWLRLEPSVLLFTGFTKRLQIWPGLATLLNALAPAIKMCENNNSFPLPEDRELQGFLPLEKAFTTYSFKSSAGVDNESINELRASRLMQLGQWLASLDNPRLLTTKLAERGVTFEAVGTAVNLQQLPLPHHDEQLLKVRPDNLLEKPERAGILKSSSNAGEARIDDSWKGPRARQNVAMQAILRRSQEQESAATKQVKFVGGPASCGASDWETRFPYPPPPPPPQPNVSFPPPTHLPNQPVPLVRRPHGPPVWRPALPAQQDWQQEINHHHHVYMQPPPNLYSANKIQPPYQMEQATYSLFSPGMAFPPVSQPHTQTSNILSNQSLWSGPGPSPLERLLEQQKQQLREGQGGT